MTYDQAGNNRLTEFRVGFQRVVASLSYDGDGKRREVTVDVGPGPGPGGGDPDPYTLGYLWDPNNPLPLLAEEDDPASNDRRYIYGHDLLYQENEGHPEETYFHYDAIGSVVNTTDQFGSLVSSVKYEPFGQARETELQPVDPYSGFTHASSPMFFTGEYLDDWSGQYHLRARQYEPGTGRFLQPDPIPPFLTDPFFSAYPYVANRPTVLVDPSGLSNVTLGHIWSEMWRHQPSSFRAGCESLEAGGGLFHCPRPGVRGLSDCLKGTAAGSLAGARIGTIVPGFGTLAGAIGGGISGCLLGAHGLPAPRSTI